ncbi:MAG: hypothetical protein KDC38_12600 [Planctomycetes bacterium]|nr:hypothetical protein [Planctomycetota bacterium]
MSVTDRESGDPRRGERPAEEDPARTTHEPHRERRSLLAALALDGLRWAAGMALPFILFELVRRFAFVVTFGAPRGGRAH